MKPEMLASCPSCYNLWTGKRLPSGNSKYCREMLKQSSAGPIVQMPLQKLPGVSEKLLRTCKQRHLPLSRHLLLSEKKPSSPLPPTRHHLPLPGRKTKVACLNSHLCGPYLIGATNFSLAARTYFNVSTACSSQIHQQLRHHGYSVVLEASARPNSPLNMPTAIALIIMLCSGPKLTRLRRSPRISQASRTS